MAETERQEMTDVDQFKADLQALIFSEEFRGLSSQQPRFNPFKALGVVHRELSHSALLAYFLDPNKPHGCGDTVLRHFLNACFAEAQQASSGLNFEAYLKLDLSSVRVQLERHNIDVLVTLPNGAGAVFGIENKIWAREQQNQVQRYQKTLLEHYDHCATKALIFLTPRGHQSETVDFQLANGGKVFYVSVPYLRVVEALTAAIPVAAPEVANFIELTVRHIKEDIVGDQEISELVRTLYSNPTYARALKTVFDNRPQFRDLLENKYQAKLQSAFLRVIESKIEFACYPKRGETTEIWAWFPEWHKAGLPLTFLCYRRPDGTIGNRLLVLADHFKAADSALYAKLHEADEFAVKLLTEDSRRMPDLNGWYIVLSEADLPEESFVEDFSYGESAVDKCVRIQLDCLERVKAAVQKVLSGNLVRETSSKSRLS